MANVWDIDTCIPLAPVTQQVWIPQPSLLHDTHASLIFVHRETHKVERIAVTIERHIGEPDSDYAARAGRVVDMVAKTISLHNVTPEWYNECIF